LGTHACVGLTLLLPCLTRQGGSLQPDPPSRGQPSLFFVAVGEVQGGARPRIETLALREFGARLVVAPFRQELTPLREERLGDGDVPRLRGERHRGDQQEPRSEKECTPGKPRCPGNSTAPGE